MPNAFSKQVSIAFSEALAGFEDQLVVSKNVTRKELSAQDAERSSDTIWVPHPYILSSYSGTDMTANFGDVTQLSVPLTMGNQQAVPFKLSMKNTRDAEQEAKLVTAAVNKLASDINKSVSLIAAMQGSLVVKRTTAAGTYDDIAQAENIMTEQGIPLNDRFMALNVSDSNGLAKDLASASRPLAPSSKSLTAYEKSLIGEVSNFQTHKVEYATRLNAAAGGAITISTLAATTPNHYLPKATVTYLGAEVNVDNRFHQVTVSSTVNVAAGDCFTIATCNAVNHQTKDSTGNLKTFRVVSVDSGTTMTITPPIISNQQTTGNAAALQYKNCTFTTLSATSAIVWLNTAAAPANIFWQKDAIILMPGRYALGANDGVATMTATTESGIEVVVSKFRDIKTNDTYLRADSLWGAIMANSEMAGIELFSQV
jgi:hypothetical protein